MSPAPVRAAMLLAALGAGVAAGVLPARIGGHEHAISRAAAIASASRELPIHDVRVIGAQRGAFHEFWPPGSEDFTAPRDERVWAVTFAGMLGLPCGGLPPPGQQVQCASRVETMMVIVDARDGAFIEGMAPAPVLHAR